MKTHKKKIIIDYFIRSEKCCKYIVKGCKTFREDAASIRFIKRLVKVKNELCKRVDLDKFKATVSERNRNNRWTIKYHCTDIRQPFNEDGLPFTLSYQCKTIS